MLRIFPLINMVPWCAFEGNKIAGLLSHDWACLCYVQMIGPSGAIGSSGGTSAVYRILCRHTPVGLDRGIPF